jgi:transcriptional regulator with XRE-family HTH domain
MPAKGRGPLYVKGVENRDNVGATPLEQKKRQFGATLQHHILDRGWRQADLARAAGIGPDNVSVYVRGKSMPGPTHLRKIADALRVHADDLLPGILDESDERTGRPSSILLREISGKPGRVWLHVERELDYDRALEILQMLRQEDRNGSG